MMTDQWRKSTRSADSANCVETRQIHGQVQVRDTKQHGTGPVLTFTGQTWADFIAYVKTGGLDR